MRASAAASEATKIGDAGDWDASEAAAGAPSARLFVLGCRLDAAKLREALRACMVPPGFSYAADEEIDFGVRPTNGVADGEGGDDFDDDGFPIEDCDLTKKAASSVRERVEADLSDGRKVVVFVRGEGAYGASEVGGREEDNELEVIKMFGSSLYVGPMRGEVAHSLRDGDGD